MSNNKRSKIILSNDIHYAWITIKELIVIMREYMRKKYISNKNDTNPRNPLN